MLSNLFQSFSYTTDQYANVEIPTPLEDIPEMIDLTPSSPVVGWGHKKDKNKKDKDKKDKNKDKNEKPKPKKYEEKSDE